MSLGVVPARFVANKRRILLCVCKERTNETDISVVIQFNSNEVINPTRGFGHELVVACSETHITPESKRDIPRM